MTPNIRIEAKKSLGQNFLVNEGVLDRIVQAAQLDATQTVLEVGPGTGALTGRLVACGARVIAIEKDQRLIEPLTHQFPTARIIEGDILAGLPADIQSPYKIVANIPYYLTSHLIRLMLYEWPAPQQAVLMVQEEVAHRMMAQAPDMNLLALSVQLVATPTLVMRVSAGSFRPIPTVDSAVIAIAPIPNADRALAEKVLATAKKAFAQKRKQLKSIVPAPILEQTGIAPMARPQELSVAQWVAIAHLL